ncbi:PREDICTED: uncharacterized protein LOC18598244 [Theobroma cacao]|uniref:Uncharacterized protein LOC18598244 n=1 Tax=Theobroma cacao TaxID=3641 RepID=A0AB32WB69_THECC|nr:PREDICTED: uncharacterized protein LOC18598244 [Theobroma cacao]
MGNCLVLDLKIIKVMKTDGKILEYQAPIKVQQVLSDFSGHALSDSFSGLQHLRPDAKLLRGQLYYLVPVPSPHQKAEKKKVRFSTPEVNDEQGSAGVVRIKLIISKQELQELLQKERVSVHDMISQIQSKESTKGVDKSDGGDNCKGWKPVLESIDEVN